MSVIEAVYAYDGRHVDDLRAAVEQYGSADGAILIELCSSGDGFHRVAATWVVKAALERGLGGSLDLRTYFSCLATEREPEALLHLLQSVQFAPAAAVGHRASVGALLDHERLLVALWALDAYVHLALEAGEDIDQARDRVVAGLAHQKASMRARARHLAPLLGL